MGSKTPQHEDSRGNGHPLNSTSVYGDGGRPRGAHTVLDGDGCLGDSDGDDDGDGDGQAAMGSLKNPENIPKKKKKSSHKKKKKTAAPLQQSSPPRVLLADLYPDGNYPVGEIQIHSKLRTTTAEDRYNARQVWNDENYLRNYRKAAEVHRQTRKWVQDTVKPGHNLLDIAEGIEDSVRALLGHAGLETGDSLAAGLGFPTGLCLNHQMAHYTPNPGQKEVVLQ